MTKQRPHKRTFRKTGKTIKAGRGMTCTDKSPAFKVETGGGPYHRYKDDKLSKSVEGKVLYIRDDGTPATELQHATYILKNNTPQTIRDILRGLEQYKKTGKTKGLHGIHPIVWEKALKIYSGDVYIKNVSLHELRKQRDWLLKKYWNQKTIPDEPQGLINLLDHMLDKMEGYE